MRKTLLSAILFFLLFSTFLPVSRNVATDWLTGWQYRKKHEIQGSIAGAVTDYQIRIIVHNGSGVDSGENVYLNGKCRTDFGDVRFTSDDGVTLLNYWIEEKKDGNYTIFWIKIPNIPTNPSTATIYIYYGNPTATNISNGDSTFIFFDHFEGTSLNLNKWVIRQGDVDIIDSNLILTGTSGTRGLIDGLTSFSYPKALYVRVKLLSTHTNTHFCSMRKPNDWTYRAGDGYDHGANPYSFETWNAGAKTQTYNIHLATPTNYHLYKIFWKMGSSKWYQNDTLIVEHTTNVPTVDQVVVFYEGDRSGSAYIDWVFVREWIDPEPTHGAWGVEESYVAPSEEPVINLSNALLIAIVISMITVLLLGRR